MWPHSRNPWSHQKLEEARSAFTTRVFRLTHTCNTLTSDFWPLILWENSLVAFRHSTCGDLLQQTLTECAYPIRAHSASSCSREHWGWHLSVLKSLQANRIPSPWQTLYCTFPGLRVGKKDSRYVNYYSAVWHVSKHLHMITHHHTLYTLILQFFLHVPSAFTSRTLQVPHSWFLWPPVFLQRYNLISQSWGFPSSSVLKNLPTNAGGTRDEGLIPGSGTFPSRRKWQPTPVFLPGESPWTEKPTGYHPQDHEKWDMSDWAQTTSLSWTTSGDSALSLPGPLGIVIFPSCFFIIIFSP